MSASILKCELYCYTLKMFMILLFLMSPFLLQLTQMFSNMLEGNCHGNRLSMELEGEKKGEIKSQFHLELYPSKEDIPGRLISLY